MLNMDEVNLTKSEWNHGEKIFEGGGAQNYVPEGVRHFAPKNSHSHDFPVLQPLSRHTPFCHPLCREISGADSHHLKTRGAHPYRMAPHFLPADTVSLTFVS